MSKISYLVSTYNSGHFLDRHIENLISGQTDRDFEILIGNPNSPGTDEIIAKKWTDLDNRIRYFYWPQREPYGMTWTRLWKEAKSPIWVNSNTDDFHHQDFTKTFSYVMSNVDKNIGFCYSGMFVLDESGRPINGGKKPQFDFEVYSRECWGGPQICIRNDQEFLSKINFDLVFRRANEHISAFDYWLALYIMSLGFRGYVIQEILTYYVQRNSSIGNADPFLNNYETYASISEFFPYNFNTHLKHAKEFRDFNNLPDKTQWLDCMRAGKKWR